MCGSVLSVDDDGSDLTLLLLPHSILHRPYANSCEAVLVVQAHRKDVAIIVEDDGESSMEAETIVLFVY